MLHIHEPYGLTASHIEQLEQLCVARPVFRLTSWTGEGSSGGRKKGGGVRSGPGAVRTILLFHAISARPSEQPCMVASTLGVYSFGLSFVSARTKKKFLQKQN